LRSTRIELNTSHHRSVCAPSNAGDSSWAELGAAFLRGAHDGGSEFTRVNNRCSVWRTESASDDYVIGKPAEFCQTVTTMVAIRNDSPAIGDYALVGSIADNLVGQGGMKLKAAPR
jgi:hypothetical protein